MGVYKLSTAGGLKTPRTNYSSFLAGNPVFVDSAYESIASASGTGSSNTISFTSIPQTFTHLQIRGIAKPTMVDAVIRLGYNGITDATQYNTHVLIGDGTSASSFYEGNQHYIYYFTNNVATGDTYGAGVIDILDYTNTNKFKVARALSGTDKNGSGAVLMTSHLYRSTNAITQIDLILNQGNFTTGTRIALYGIKGA
jgi:hypothetical protein